MIITLESIWNSSTGLLQRFGLKPTLEASWDKVIEEQHEAIEALHKMQRKHLKGNDIWRAHFSCETGDCLVTLLNAAYAVGMTGKELWAITPLNSLWVNAETDQAERERLMDLSLSTYPLYLQLVDIRNGDTTATLYDVAAYLAECIKALIVVAKGAGLTYGEFEAALETVCYKNDHKSHETHEIVGGMICRRKPTVSVEEQS